MKFFAVSLCTLFTLYVSKVPTFKRAPVPTVQPTFKNPNIASQTLAIKTPTYTYSKDKTKHTFTADIALGVIGTAPNIPIDDPFDNCFHISIRSIETSSAAAFLQYELYGVRDHTSISRSINDAQAIGGQFIQLSDEWSVQKEPIPIAVLKQGDNVIRFTLPSNATHHYRIKNLSIVIDSTPTSDAAIVITNGAPVYYQDKAYIKGIVRQPFKDFSSQSQSKLFCNDVPVSIYNGEFECVVQRSVLDSGNFSAMLTAVFAKGHTISKTLHFTQATKADFEYEPLRKGEKRQEPYVPDRGLVIEPENAIAAGITIPAHALSQAKVISVTALRDVDLPPLQSDLINVTRGAKGYRFLPHGTHFGSSANVTIPFDSTLIPDGYTSADIRTYYFNEVTRKWAVLVVDTLMQEKGVLTSKTTHFTDMIDGIIIVPESPQTQGYTPTSIKDLKAAAPSAGIEFINPPAANSMGTASVGFNLKLPKGRQGMQPSLSIQYSNEGGNSWLGHGWNLSTPFIGIDTRWGVPRYDTQNETETYMFGGQQLAPIVHKSRFVSRTSEKVFHHRVEESFNLIIRHGDSPKTYWWEVTSKSGVKSYYGGSKMGGTVPAATLTDDEGNIAYWGLVETRDPNDNVIHYIYKTVSDSGTSGSAIPGKQLYLSHIYYTGTGQTHGAYAVEFERGPELGEPSRKDIDISGRLGFKMVTADVLRKVHISYNGELIRTYDLSYKQGAFYKTLLHSVSEIDNTGAVFYSHRFEYFDDVNTQGGFTPFGIEENWSPLHDSIFGDISNTLSDYTGHATVLGTSKSSNTSKTRSRTRGKWDGNIDKSNTVGTSVGTGSASTEGIAAFIDINGDGLPDKVFKKSGKLWYRPNLGESVHQFGSVRHIQGIDNFSSGTAITRSKGTENNYKKFFGKEKSNTTTTTTDYFSDFNGDGLVDIVRDGQVYFNRITNNGDPEFMQGSTGTPSPIIAENGVERSFLAPDTVLQRQQGAYFPLQDIVRFWEAPFEGVISIHAPVRLIDVSIPGVNKRKRDGVRVSIQLGNTPLWSDTILKDDYTFHIPPDIAVSHLRIFKGQRVYFRLQSMYNGESDVVAWNPLITFNSVQIPATDANNRATDSFYASKDFVLSSAQAIALVKDGTIKIQATFSKPITSDTVVLHIAKKSAGTTISLYRKSFGVGEATDNFNDSFSVSEGDSLGFEILSDSYIDRAALHWAPRYTYTSFATKDSTPIEIDGKPTITESIVPDNTNFNHWKVLTPLLKNIAKDTITIVPLIPPGISASGLVTFTVKGKNMLYGKRKFNVKNGNIVGTIQSIQLIREPNTTLFCEYHIADTALANAVDTPSYSIKRGNAIDTLQAGLFTNPPQEYVGSLFRGWGQFSITGDRSNAPLDERKLTPNEITNYVPDPAEFVDSASLETLTAASLPDFIPLNPDGERLVWVGSDSSVFVSDSIMGSSRLYLPDVSVDSIMVGASLTAVHKIVKSTTESSSYGNGRTKSETTTTHELDMMDMNGDRYPDVLHRNTIQYSQPYGSLEQSTTTHSVGQATFNGISQGSTDGGSYPVASAKNTPSFNAQNASSNARSTSGLTKNESTVTNDDEVQESWLDINADGLPDKIYQNGEVQLNLGYRFASKEHWHFTEIDESISRQNGTGSTYGYARAFRSFQGGKSWLESTGDNTTSFEDMNGDGLPDKLLRSSAIVNVQLNSGSGFETPVAWSQLQTIRGNSSTGETSTKGVTKTTILAKVSQNPPSITFWKDCKSESRNSGNGVSRENDQISDIDGDGYSDILHSSSDSNLTVQRSTIGRTNMLKSVRRPLGASFTIDYERVGNTYAMPQSKWVLKSVAVFDGVKGDGVDTMKNSFSYAQGNYNRDEREFYGFKTVTTNQLNTAANNKLYRSTIQEYSNTDYYTKGLLEREWIQNDVGNKYVETTNRYEPVSVHVSVKFPALVRTDKLFYEGAVTHAIQTYTAFKYDSIGNVTQIYDAGDGSIQDWRRADITYHDIQTNYIKNIPASIIVNTNDSVKRKRATTIDNNGNILQIHQYLTDDSIATYDFNYDAYGNQTSMTHPKNYKNQRMWYGYTYDDAVHTYVTVIKDTFGYTSTNSYDYLFGELTGTVSMNNDSMRYTYDTRGRIVTVTSPYELAKKLPFTIQYEYHSDATEPYTVTRLYNPEHGSNIPTITFVDGLSRPLQIKKLASVFNDKNMPDFIRMIITGRVLYDAFGRAVESRYPTVENIGANNRSINTTLGIRSSQSTFDVLDRVTSTHLPDGASDSVVYSLSNDLFTTRTIDAKNNATEVQSDVKERKRATRQFNGASGAITTTFHYNALNELIRVEDAKKNNITTTYDNLGRKQSVNHPDAGGTEYIYDLAGNVLKKITAQIRHEIPDGGAIQYQYDFSRLTDVDYPRQYQNKVKYVYGKAGTGSRTGRIILQQDASGGQEFFYGKLGEVTKTIRTVMVNNVFYTTYVSEQEYDSWNRIKTMTYPDGEVIRYYYDQGGSLDSINGQKLGQKYQYVKQLGFNEFQQRVYLQYGNGTENRYAYDTLRRRLSSLQSYTSSGRMILNNTYEYDAVSNIEHIVNQVQSTPGTLGGYAKQDFTYDPLYRLEHSSGEYKGAARSATYALSMEYDPLYNVTHKKMEGTQPGDMYEQEYLYNGKAHQPTRIGSDNYTYDFNGNLLTKGSTQHFWDEENRLMAVIQNRTLSRYTYDADGERVVKSSGGIQGTWVNGAPAGLINHDSNYVAYVSPYFVARRTSFTKHIYIESQRIASKIGSGSFTNISFPQAALTAGGIDYLKRAANIQRQRIDYYASLGISPGPPTDKYFYAHPYNSGIAAPIILDSTASSIPRGWPGNTTPPLSGPPIFVSPIPSNDSVKAGYGFRDRDKVFEQNQYFYHPDHLGSTSYVTDALGEVSQHQEYAAFGETYFEEHTNSPPTPYLYNAKERDTETGLYYYGARYYDPKASQWVSVDPMAEDYPGVSPYNYTLNNPVILIDPDGKAPIVSSGEVTERVTNFMEWFTGANVDYNGSGWGHGPRRWLANRSGLMDNANNLLELGLQSQLQNSQVNLTGNLLNEIKADPSMVALRNNIVTEVKSDARFGKSSFGQCGYGSFEFGGKRAPGDMIMQLMDPLNEKYADTWKVAGNALTWATRHSTVSYQATAQSNGIIVISYHLADNFDLSPQRGRSSAYNNVSSVAGFLYHDVLGGNRNLKVNADWEETIR